MGLERGVDDALLQPGVSALHHAPLLGGRAGRCCARRSDSSSTRSRPDGSAPASSCGVPRLRVVGPQHPGARAPPWRTARRRCRRCDRESPALPPAAQARATSCRTSSGKPAPARSTKRRCGGKEPNRCRPWDLSSPTASGGNQRGIEGGRAMRGLGLGGQVGVRIDEATATDRWVSTAAGDEQAHDLGRALEDPADPQVAQDRSAGTPSPLASDAATVSGPRFALDLHQLVGDQPRHLGRAELGEGRLDADIVAVFIRHLSGQLDDGLERKVVAAMNATLAATASCSPIGRPTGPACSTTRGRS